MLFIFISFTIGFGGDGNTITFFSQFQAEIRMYVCVRVAYGEIIISSFFRFAQRTSILYDAFCEYNIILLFSSQITFI